MSRWTPQGAMRQAYRAQRIRENRERAIEVIDAVGEARIGNATSLEAGTVQSATARALVRQRYTDPPEFEITDEGKMGEGRLADGSIHPKWIPGLRTIRRVKEASDAAAG